MSNLARLESVRRLISAGCATCKSKRLKCDETKPTCNQCARRNKVCGGYTKEFKWKSCEPAATKAKAAASDDVGGTKKTSKASPNAAHASSQLSSPLPYAIDMAWPPQMLEPRSASLFEDASFEGAPAEALDGFSGDWTATVGTRTDLLDAFSGAEARSQSDAPRCALSSDPWAKDGLEEVSCQPPVEHELWAVRQPTPSITAESKVFPMLMPPPFSRDSTENLVRRFDRDTCGILSVKDGPTENPWRTLVWPLAPTCPALYHAIASMTSFHQAMDMPQMRLQGIEHVRSSVRTLLSSMHSIRLDAAISTTLTLAWAESWDKYTSTGIVHITGARQLIDKALAQHRVRPLRGIELARLRFLCNTWLYMAVIARLTTPNEREETKEFNTMAHILQLTKNDPQVDPLMGCASTLFPLIGRAASLVSRVRRIAVNSAPLISEAGVLKAQLETWEPPHAIEQPEDETTSVHDSVKTAIAYKYATLLYLHQAVPELPSLPSSMLAHKVLCELATVEPRSRAVIVQIFPLVAAGCEATSPDDRRWVLARWAAMHARMKIGVIDCCAAVSCEVWRRRDAFAAQRQLNLGCTVPTLRRDSESSLGAAQRHASFHGASSVAPVFGAQQQRRPSVSAWPPASGDYDGKRRALSVSSAVPFYGTESFDPTAAVAARTGHRRWDRGVEAIDHEFTVRGSLHWLGVMGDWDWEGECLLHVRELEVTDFVLVLLG